MIPEVNSTSSGTTESSWVLAGAKQKRSYESWPANPRVYPKAVEGLLDEGVLAKGRLSAKAFTPVGTSEEARRSEAGHRVADGEGGLVGSESEELLPEVFLTFQRLAA